MTFKADEDLEKKGTWMKDSNVHVNATKYPKLTYSEDEDGRLNLLENKVLLTSWPRYAYVSAAEQFKEFRTIYEAGFNAGRAIK